MRNSQSKVLLKKATLAIVCAGAIGMTNISQASQKAEQRFQTEVSNCVLEIKNQIDVQGATRIWHNITDYKPIQLGNAVTIKTSVFTPDSQYDYEIICQISGNHKPYKIRVNAV